MATSIGGSTGGTGRKIGAIGGRTSSGTSGGVSHPAGRRPLRTGADRFKAVLVEQGAISNRSHVTEEHGKEHEDRGDDSKSREIVLEYERNRGREAKAMAPDRPGYDTESTEPEAGMVRRIEVRGMQGAYKEDASVLLSDRQGRDALRNESSKIQYRLYVVDCMDTETPNVHPVSWTENHLRFGLCASAWANVDKRWRGMRHGRHCYPSRCCMSGGPYEIAGGVGPVAHLRNRTIHARIPHPAAIMACLRIDRFQPLVVVQRAHFVVPSIGRQRSRARIMRSRREYLRAPRLRAACAGAESA